MTCAQYLTTEQTNNIGTVQLINVYEQGYTIKNLSSCVPQMSAGEAININAAPIGGIAPYSVSFYKKLNISDPVQIGIIQTSILEAINSTTPSTATVPYTITDADVAAATGDSIVIPQLPPGYIRIITSITDSCPAVSGGPKTYIESCDIYISCVSQICDIIVE